MTKDSITLEVQKRDVVRKRLAGVRNNGIVPAVLHNHGKDSTLIAGEYGAVVKVFAQAGKHHPVELIVDGKKQLVLIKDVDREPAKNRIRHIVFQSIKQNEAVEAEVPIVFKEGVEIPAQKASLMVLQQLDVAQVKALPKDLPDQLEVDPSSLVNDGDSLTVADIIVPNGVTILTDPEHQLAVVETPKDQLAEANATAEALAQDADKPDAETVEESQESAESAKAE